MTFASALALFSVMLVLAAAPSSSVLIVVTLSATSGFIHGLLAALGIVTGDILFILIAISGLSFLAESTSELFNLVKYLGAAYLVWMGLGLWRSTTAKLEADGCAEKSLTASFISGLLFTLADQKAILFYSGFFPAFLDLSALTLSDTATVLLITLFAVGGVKIAYAYWSNRVVTLLNGRARQGLNMIAGGIMMAVAAFVVAGV
jgi:threonine/homoserine/homoserine lactone efflux protein